MIKSLLHKALAVLVGVGILCGASYYEGYKTPRNIDPQDYIQTTFMPYESGIDTALKFLDGTKHSLRIAIYSMTDPRIADKLLELRQRGVKAENIKLLLDSSQTIARSGKYEQAQIARLREVGIEVTIGTSEQRHNIMHQKVIVRDGEWVLDGSWNFTKSANSQGNEINVMESPKRAALFMTDWNRMYAFMKTQNQTPWVKDMPAEPEQTEPEPE